MVSRWGSNGDIVTPEELELRILEADGHLRKVQEKLAIVIVEKKKLQDEVERLRASLRVAHVENTSLQKQEIYHQETLEKMRKGTKPAFSLEIHEMLCARHPKVFT